MTPAPTDAASFRAWRAGMGWTQPRAASELGVKTRIIQYYEREVGGQPVPRTVGLACVALALAHAE